MLAAARSSRWALSSVCSTPRRDQRPVAGEDEHVAVVVLQVRLAHPGGVAGAELLGLLDPRDPLVVAELGDDLVLAVPDDHHHPVAPRAEARLQHVVEHRLAAHLVQHLRALRLHPRRLAGGEDDGGEGHGDGRATPPGFEP